MQTPTPAAAPASLPIYDHAEAIVNAVRNHAVVVVEGPAGSGKTTQLPRILLQAGLAPRLIGITQPRRIAAVSVAWRIAEEEAVPLGDRVGYAIRFDDATSAKTRIKVMTDGILLQEARGDPQLSAYDVLMVDEAHERSLNIDFTLGLLHRLLARRRDLRVVISSATLYPGHFVKFFRDVAGDVPVVSVKTRTYPIDIQYHPLRRQGPADLVEGTAQHVVRLHREAPPGHMLVFMPGEGLIQKTETAINTLMPGAGLIVLPLYGRLTREEQERVFEDFPGKRKAILSTNIAETSITIEGVHYVIDTGLAKLPWFNAHTGVNTLREEPISQASATQRAGRAGRLGPGTVLRLYDEQSFAQRPQFTPEEILRVDLSEAVLRLIDLGVRDVENFDFPTPPPRKKLLAALDSLMAINAIDRDRNLTEVGRRMVPFPLSPPLARMVVEAAERFPKALNDVLLVGAFLSVRSPMMYPPGEEDGARAAQSRLAQPLGDAVTSIHTYYAWQSAGDKRAFASKYYIDYDTMAFIERAHGQLRDIAESHGAQVLHGRGDPKEVVRCVATGFADKVMIARGYVYETPQELRVAIHPSSSMYSRKQRIVVAAELMNSGRTYAFNVSALEPEWLHDVNPEAARLWQITPKASARRVRDAAPQAAPAAPLPNHISVNDVTLPVSHSRRRAVVEIAAESIAALTADGPITPPPGTGRWRARLTTAQGVFLRGPLSYVLALLPHVVLPGDSGAKSQTPPLGVLLEVDRNMHTLERYLDVIGMPVSTPHNGWLALISNGGGGFWYDLIGDFPESVQATLQALEDLMEHSYEIAHVEERLLAMHKHYAELHERVTGALASAQKARKKKR